MAQHSERLSRSPPSPRSSKTGYATFNETNQHQRYQTISQCRHHIESLVTETPIEKTDKELEQDTATAEVLADLFADDTNTEQLTTAKKLQLQQEQESPKLSSSTDPSIRANGADEFSG